MTGVLKNVSIRLVEDAPIYSQTPVKSPDDAVLLIGNDLSLRDRECFCVLNLMADGKVINFNIVSIGSLNASLVEPREVFKSSILSNSASIILIHNHPSGDLRPSREDILITERLIFCGEMLGIPVKDHVITGAKGKYYSFLENNQLDESRDKIMSMGYEHITDTIRR